VVARSIVDQPLPERRCSSAGLPAAPESTRPRTEAWRPASTLSRLLPGAMSAAMAACAARVPSERAVPGSAASEMAKQSAPSAVAA
jgi:hypothetical protein